MVKPPDQRSDRRDVEALDGEVLDPGCQGRAV